MKSTGVVRRIDELGRIVIPKEIRKSLRIRSGDNVEIFIDNNENIILSKYSSIGKINDFAENFAQTIQKFVKHDVIITDNDKIIASCGTLKKKYESSEISNEMLKFLNKRELYQSDEKIDLKIINDEFINGYFLISPIIVESDSIGMIIIRSTDEKLTVFDNKIIQFVTSFFIKYLDD